MVPYDVLVDPLSLPTHKIIEKKTTMEQIIHGGDDDVSLILSPGLVRQVFLSYCLTSQREKHLGIALLRTSFLS